MGIWLFGTYCSALAYSSDPELYDAQTGMRTSRYRAPVPDEIPGATRIFVEELDRLARFERAVVIDVAPAEGGIVEPATGKWVGYKSHQHIPNSIWLPNTGRGDAPPNIIKYFETNLARLTGGDKARPVIIYCYSDCWMSWNAVKRALALGYSRVFWFPEGTDGWRDWDMPFAPAEPVSLPH